MLTSKKLHQVYNHSQILPYDNTSKFIIFSDCHRGLGNSSDNFLANQNLFFAALNHYYKNEYTYIEIGDGDELWENRNIDDIIQVHSDAFWMMSNFYYNNRLYFLFGNHDMVKKNKDFCNNSFCNFYSECNQCNVPLFPEIKIHESIILKNSSNTNKIFLVHGHQGDLINDTLWLLGRWLVRYVWRPLELIGFNAPTYAAKTHKHMLKIEKSLSKFATSTNTILIAGHTHRPAFAKPGAPPYFNDGSCVHPRCITGIEIANNTISLVKWSVKPDDKNMLYIAKDTLEGPININLYFQ
ncbi:MAG: metallophosphoesterase [Lachnotalea sp.]